MRSLVVLPMLAATLVGAQHADVPLQRDFYIDVERNASARASRVHVGLKPVIESRTDLTNVMGHRVDSAKYYWPYMEKLFRDHLFIVREGDVHIAVDPLFRFEVGDDFGDQTLYGDTNNLYMNVRGFRVKADLGPKVSIQTMFHEVQAIVPQYLFQQTVAIGTMPGEARVKLRQNRVLDYGWSQGSVSYVPVDWLHVQMGHGKHFVGHGYRSVLLSDLAPPAPFLKFSALTRNKRFQYSTWHTKMVHGVNNADRLPTSSPAERLFQWYRARFNHMGLLLGPVELGLFEVTRFLNIGPDGVRPFDMQELNPVIGINTLRYGFRANDRNMVGADLRVKLRDKWSIYGQFGTDDPANDRYAWQAGLRIFDLLRRDIHLQVEYNSARPFMYQSDPVDVAHVHMGLPLAHPFGAYFDEWVAILDAGFGRVIGQAKLNLATVRADRNNAQNHGIDLLKPETPLLSSQGPRERQLTFLDLNVSYLFNPVSNFRFTVGMRRRDLPGATDAQQSTYIYAALATNLFNRYHDL